MTLATRHRSTLVGCATVGVGTLLVLGVTLWARFPLVYSDTGTYLRSAFDGFVPLDRPYWYGVFVRCASVNGASLWGVPVVQALLCAALTWRCWRHFGNGRPLEYLLSVAVLAPITGLGWYAGQLVPDILTTIGLLAGMLFLTARAGVVERAGWAFLMLLACWSHLSNLMVLPLTLGATVLVARMSRLKIPPHRVIACMALLVAAWPGLWVANRALTGEGHISRYTHVFLMGRLVDTGILPAYLDEHCGRERYGICAHRDSLPSTSREFMWNSRSPLSWQGGPEAVRGEYAAIVRSTLRQPRYLAMHVVGSVRSTLRLLGNGRLADELEGDYYRQSYSPPYAVINGLLPGHMPAYLNSRQNTGQGILHLDWLGRGYRTVLAGSFLVLLVLLLPRYRDRRTVVVSAFALGTVVVSAWVCATFSTEDTRYMARTAWMLPWCAAMLAFAKWRRTGAGWPPAADQPPSV